MKKYGILLASIMFLWSDKIKYLILEKVATLMKKDKFR